jgi:tRNA G10  N-methylase Trm11
LILKLRSNIELEGDLQLAELEITKLLGRAPEPLGNSAFHALAANGSLQRADFRHCRANGIVAYRVQVERLHLVNLFKRLSFVELVAGVAPLPREHWDKIVKEFEILPTEFIRLELAKGRAHFRLVPFNTAVEWSDVIAKRATSPDEAVNALKRTLALALEGKLPNRGDVLPERAMSAKLTTGHLFHGFHVYKAKFFPRMVRALLNLCSPHPTAYMLDPYVGSGTALTEASVMGMPSAGVDIDPLAALIATTKVKLVHESDGETLKNVLVARERLDTLRTGQLPLFSVRERQAAYAVLIPSFLTRRIPAQTQVEITEDISLVLSAISWFDKEAALPLRVALSDAISRKFKFRFLGLGYGRFALNIMPGRIVEMFSNNLDYLAKSAAVWRWLRQAANLTLAPSEVRLGDARSLPFNEGTFDLIVTSPPYLPASSGRENYLKSKALAMIALGLMDVEKVDAYERMQVGSVHRSENPDELPPKAREVVEWMAADEVRQVKARATASYFIDLAQSLREIRRVLRSGGLCAMVIAKQHVFYRYKSREVVRIIDNAEVVSELATRCGLEVEDAIHVELNKQNTVARPRSLDAYYETILILRRP